MNLADIVGGVLMGGVGGLASGFLGVTSGGRPDKLRIMLMAMIGAMALLMWH
jgi:hypothetical protein